MCVLVLLNSNRTHFVQGEKAFTVSIYRPIQLRFYLVSINMSVERALLQVGRWCHEYKPCRTATIRDRPHTTHGSSRLEFLSWRLCEQHSCRLLQHRSKYKNFPSFSFIGFFLNQFFIKFGNENVRIFAYSVCSWNPFFFCSDIISALSSAEGNITRKSCFHHYKQQVKDGKLPRPLTWPFTHRGKFWPYQPPTGRRR